MRQVLRQDTLAWVQRGLTTMDSKEIDALLSRVGTFGNGTSLHGLAAATTYGESLLQLQDDTSSVAPQTWRSTRTC